MEATRVIRRTDDLGRITIPKEIRRMLEIRENTPMVINVLNDKIILTKYRPENILLSSVNDLEAQLELLEEVDEKFDMQQIREHVAALKTFFSDK